MISIAEQTETAQPVANAAANPTKKAHAGARRANVAPSKPKSGKKASPRKRPKARRKPKAPATAARRRKSSICPCGATSKELQKVSGWQPHSVRGFLSGTVGKKMGLTVTSTKGEDRERTYSVKA
jgi:hypothetical protein